MGVLVFANSTKGVTYSFTPTSLPSSTTEHISGSHREYLWGKREKSDLGYANPFLTAILKKEKPKTP